MLFILILLNILGGKSIKDLITVTGARISISSIDEPFPGTNDRVVLIQGNQQVVSLTQTLIWELLALIAKNSSRDFREVTWDPTTISQNLGQNNDVEVTGKFSIPAAASGSVLGKGGEFIRAMSQESGAKISMTGKDEALFTHERVITISGTVAACVKATNFIIEKLLAPDEVVQFVNKWTSYSATPNKPFGLRHKESPNEPHTESTITINIPEEYVGNIFGRNGSTMREIISLSRAKIIVSQRGSYAEGTKNRVVTITGSPSCTQTAHYYINQRLKHPSHLPHRKFNGNKNN